MARITGFRCDGPKCPTVSESDSVPDHWMTVKVHVSPRSAGLDPDRTLRSVKETVDFHLCSNRCLANLGKERHKVDIEEGRAPRRGPKPGEVA